MNNQTNRLIDRNEVINMLIKENKDYQNDDRFSVNNNYLDEYGNYVFSTDTVIKEPNIAYGSMNEFSYISYILS